MQQDAISIRPFVGTKNFGLSRAFYKDIGFTEQIISPALSLFQWGGAGFYLQDAYVKDWIDNTMVFFQVENAQQIYEEFLAMEVSKKYENVKLVPLRTEHWGRECFLHDPSGILLHFGEFFK
jgi:hypothetical protein